MANRVQVLFLVFFLFGLTHDANGGFFMERFHWLPSESAHKQYPMRLIKGDLILNDGTSLYVPARSVIDNGWGEIGSTHVVGSKMKSLPVRLTARWFSFAEDKFFTGDFPLPYEKILNMFRDGTISPSFDKKVPFDRIIIGIGPEGAISVWASVDGEVVEVARFRGNETTAEWKEILDNDQVTRRDFIDGILKDSLSHDEYRALKERGVPAGISDFFNKTYRWTFSVVGGSQQKVLVKYLNGEAEYFNFLQTQNGRTHRALPKKVQIRWGNTAGKRSMADIILDEAEVDAAYRTLSGGDTEHPMQLEVQIGTAPGALEAAVKDARFIIRLKKTTIKRWKVRSSNSE